MTYVIIGVLMIGVVLAWVLFRSKDFHVPNAEEANGEVMEVEQISLPGINPVNLLRGRQERSERYHPIVRFRLDHERLVRFRSRKGYRDEERYKVGDKVTVLYSKDNPLVAKIKED